MCVQVVREVLCQAEELDKTTTSYKLWLEMKEIMESDDDHR